MSKKMKYYWNSFSGRILLMVLLGIGLIAITVSFVVLNMSKQVFTETYGKSQEKVFEQIEKELNDFHGNLQKVINAIDSSWAFRLYLTGDSELDNVQTFQNIYQMEKDLEQSKTLDMERLNILVIGMEGEHYLSRTETISMSDMDILGSEAVKLAMDEPETTHYTYSHGAYTATAKDSDVIIVSRALYFRESKEIYAVVLVTLTMEDMKQYYDYFVTENTSLYLIDQNGMILCSSNPDKVGTEMEEGWFRRAQSTEQSRFLMEEKGKHLTVMQKELSYLGCGLYGIIDNDLALDRLYNMPLLIGLCAAMGIFILLMCLLFARQTMKPLSQMVEKMSRIREGNFTQYMPIEGTVEMQELAATYNYMLDDIQKYIDELMETQKAKRKSEIKALQMQINPHYIYNTLASIKWLVYQNDTERTVSTIDAFISLLRNTINNMDEFITIQQELVNLENYILINHTRYGNAVGVEYYVSRNCYDCLIPKMILQPFIENAFFHAFPYGRTGTIQIFMKQKGDSLEIKIADDGIGMDCRKAEQKKEHFSGIGIQNVQDRLKLLYGEEYGICIESTEQEGTAVTIKIPVRRKENDESKNNSGVSGSDSADRMRTKRTGSRS